MIRAAAVVGMMFLATGGVGLGMVVLAAGFERLRGARQAPVIRELRNGDNLLTAGGETYLLDDVTGRVTRLGSAGEGRSQAMRARARERVGVAGALAEGMSKSDNGQSWVQAAGEQMVQAVQDGAKNGE
jgi:hypothetical protein